MEDAPKTGCVTSGIGGADPEFQGNLYHQWHRDYRDGRNKTVSCKFVQYALVQPPV